MLPPQLYARKLEIRTEHSLLAHCLIPPLLSSFLQAFRIITPAQYCISGGKNGGFPNALSDALGLNVKRSTSENTFVILGGFELAAAAAASQRGLLVGRVVSWLPRPRAHLLHCWVRSLQLLPSGHLVRVGRRPFVRSCRIWRCVRLVHS